jgi:hypothetical protein
MELHAGATRQIWPDCSKSASPVVIIETLSCARRMVLCLNPGRLGGALSPVVITGSAASWTSGKTARSLSRVGDET